MAPGAPFHSSASRALRRYRRPLVAFKVPGKYRYVEANNGFICFVRNSSRRLGHDENPVRVFALRVALLWGGVSGTLMGWFASNAVVEGSVWETSGCARGS